MNDDIDLELTEYEVVRQVSRNERAYVMAKDHEDAVRVFDKLKDTELDIQDYDDEYKVDGYEV